MTKKSLYDELGVRKDVSKEEIKKKFRRLAKRLHPDVNGGSDEKFKKLTEAYRTLISDDLRAHYDNTGEQRERDDPGKIYVTAMNMVGSLFLKLVEEDFDNDVDYIRSIKEYCKESIRATTGETIKTNNKIKKWEALKDRILYKGKTINVLAERIDEKIRILKLAVSDTDQDIKILKIAMEIADEYEVMKPEWILAQIAFPSSGRQGRSMFEDIINHYTKGED